MPRVTPTTHVPKMSESECEHSRFDLETYSLGIDHHTPISEDRDLCYNRLIEDSARLFTSQSNNFELMFVSADGEGKVGWISDIIFFQV